MHVLDQNVEEEVKDARFVAMEEVTFEQIMDEVDSKTQGAQENIESPYDTESEIKIIKSYQAATIFGSLSMSDDDMAFISGFESQDSTDHVSEEDTETLHASVDKPALSDPLGHLHAELGILNTKVDQLESNIFKKVAEDIKSFVPAIVAHTLKEQLPGLLFDAIKDTLPRLIKDSIKCFISESILEELPQVEAQVQKNLHDQLPTILVKPMYKEFNALNKLKSQRFVLLKKELSTSLHNKMRKSTKLKDLRIMFKDMVSLLETAEVFQKANAEGEKWEKNNPGSLAEEKEAQHPDQTKGEQDSGPTTIAISSDEDTSRKKETDDEPPAKKLKFLIPPSSISSPTPLKYIMPEPPKVTDAIKITLDQFTEHLSKTTSSISSPTPLREPTPPRDFTKGKEVAITEEQVNKFVSYQEEGGSNPKMPKIKADKLPITKINYVVNPNKKATMKITRGDNPLNLIVYPNFRVKTLGFSEWLKVYKLASKKFEKSNNMLLQSLRAKFQWVINQAKKLGLPLPPALATFGMTAEDQKRKRTEILKEVFVTETSQLMGCIRT
ncbi:hypothetical protein Tco_1393988 [Tanacetum coccineum]